MAAASGLLGPVPALSSLVPQKTGRAQLLCAGGPYGWWKPLSLVLNGRAAEGRLGKEAGDGWKRVRREGQQVGSEGDGLSVQCREQVAALHVVQSRLDEVRSFLDEPPAERATQEGGG